MVRSLPQAEKLAYTMRDKHQMLDFTSLGLTDLRVVVILNLLFFPSPYFFFLFSLGLTFTLEEGRQLSLES